MQTKFKLIALDIDGTLLGRDQEISAQNLLWIEKARNAGMEVTLSTGRNRDVIVQTFSKQLNIDVPIVTLNGGEIWSPGGELLSRNALSEEDAFFLYHLAKEHDVWCYGFNEFGLMEERNFPQSLSESTWIKFVYRFESARMMEVIRKQVQQHGGLELTSSNMLNIEVNAKGVTKASGLEMICNKLCIDKTQVIAMGDGLNDVSMIQWAGLGIAMGNAPQEVKQVAVSVTDTCDNNGVAKAIAKVLQQG